MVRTTWGGLLALCAALASLAPGAAGAKTTVPNRCAEEKLLYEVWAFAIGKEAKPPQQKLIPAGAQVVLSAESQWPLTFHLARSKRMLGRHDLLRAKGRDAKGVNANRYLLRVPRRLTARPGKLYWDISFTVRLIGCKGKVRTFYSTALGGKPHLLTIAGRQGRRRQGSR